MLITESQTPFQTYEPLREQHDDQQVDERHGQQRDESVIGAAADDVAAHRQILQADVADHRRLLEQGDEFVAQGRQDVLERLRQDDEAVGLRGRQPERASRAAASSTAS